MIVYVNMCEVYEIIGRRGGLEEVDRELEPLKPLADFNLRDSKPLPKLCTRRHPEALEITDLPSDQIGHVHSFSGSCIIAFRGRPRLSSHTRLFCRFDHHPLS